jgi:hypothetical protein
VEAAVATALSQINASQTQAAMSDALADAAMAHCS